MGPFQHVGVSSEDHVPEVQHIAAAPHDPLCRPRWWCRGESVGGSTELLGSHWYISILSFRNWGTKQTLSISCSNLSTDSKATYKWYHLFICWLGRSDLCPVSPLLLPDNKGGTVTIFWISETKMQQVLKSHLLYLLPLAVLWLRGTTSTHIPNIFCCTKEILEQCSFLTTVISCYCSEQEISVNSIWAELLAWRQNFYLKMKTRFFVLRCHLYLKMTILHLKIILAKLC